MATAFPIAVQSVSAADSTASTAISVFQTAFGWFGLLGQDGRLCGIRIGHLSAADVVLGFAREFEFVKPTLTPHDWCPSLRQRLQKYCEGHTDDFRDVEIVYRRSVPEFRLSVLKATRRIAPGRTLSYLELATKAGSPRAARAVGNAMATNLFPIIVPCHRVVGSGGHLGGFTAPGGLDLKQQLLAMESSADLS